MHVKTDDVIYFVGILCIVFILNACGGDSVTDSVPDIPEPAETSQEATLTPVSGSDGEFEVIEADGVRFYRSAEATQFPVTYMYFQYSSEVKNRTVYVRVVYTARVIYQRARIRVQGTGHRV